LDALLLFALIVFLPFVMFFIFIFPEQFTELLIFFYNPDTRVAFIAAVLLLYLWLKYRKKHKKKKYDYLEDLSLIEGHVNGEFYHYRSLIDAKKGQTLHSLSMVSVVMILCLSLRMGLRSF
jgi:hypothetical protein